VLAALFVAGHATAADLPDLIAHAGGGIDGHTYTNSREALDTAAANGFGLVEVDFAFTRDGHLVLTHEWADVTRLYDAGGAEPPLTLAQFKTAKPRVGLHQMTVPDLGVWMRAHPSVDVMTDFKRDAVRGLEILKRELPDLQPRFVVQMYGFGDEKPMGALGYHRRILTLYRSKLSNGALRRWLPKHRVDAVAFPLRRLKSGILGVLKPADVFIYAHTVNDAEEMETLRAKGVDGFYTDWLTPESATSP
jgi:glycerophosphoryl diester phosphodiesterase